MPQINREWKKLKIGDIIFTYSKGIFRLIDITKRNKTTPLITAKKLATRNCGTCKPIKVSCDISWCRLVPQNTIDYCKTNGVNFNE